MIKYIFVAVVCVVVFVTLFASVLTKRRDVSVYGFGIAILLGLLAGAVAGAD